MRRRDIGLLGLLLTAALLLVWRAGDAGTIELLDPRAPAHRPSRVALPAASRSTEDEVKTLSLLRANDEACLRGRVVDAVNECPIPRCRITAAAAACGAVPGHDASEVVLAMTDGEGRFGIEAPHRGEIRLDAAGFVPRFVSLNGEARGGKWWLVALERSEWMSGVVRTRASQDPVSEARIEAWAESDTRCFSTKVGTLSREDGSFRLGPLPPGAVRVVVSRHGFSQFSEVIQMRDQATVQTLLLDSGGIITGSIVQDGKPLARCTVRVSAAAVGHAQAVTADAHGQFSFLNVPSGIRFVSVAAEPDAPRPGRWADVRVVVRDGQVSRVALRLPPAPSPSVSGQVWISGNLVERGVVRLRRARETDETVSFETHAVIGRLGHFEVPCVPRGRYRITVDGEDEEGKRHRAATERRLDHSGPLHLPFFLNPGSVGGKVRDANTGAPIVGANLSLLRGKDGEWVPWRRAEDGEGTSDALGRFSFSGLGPGDYRVSGGDRRGSGVSFPVRIHSSEDLHDTDLVFRRNPP